MVFNAIAQAALDALPFPIFVVDDDLRVLGLNKTAENLVGLAPELLLKQKNGEILHCIHNYESPLGCGSSKGCADCVIRKSVQSAYQGTRSTHQRARLEIKEGDNVREALLLVTVAPFEAEGARYAVLVLEDLHTLLASGSILPVCMHCKRVREGEQWSRLEKYLDDQLDMKVSHGICPECLRALYPEFTPDPGGGA